MKALQLLIFSSSNTKKKPSWHQTTILSSKHEIPVTNSRFSVLYLPTATRPNVHVQYLPALRQGMLEKSTFMPRWLVYSITKVLCRYTHGLVACVPEKKHKFLELHYFKQYERWSAPLFVVLCLTGGAGLWPQTPYQARRLPFRSD